MTECLQVGEVVKRAVVCDFADVVNFVAWLAAHDACVVVASQCLSSDSFPECAVDGERVFGCVLPVVLMLLAASTVCGFVVAAWLRAACAWLGWHQVMMMPRFCSALVNAS